jgi:hypothetical protein
LLLGSSGSDEAGDLSRTDFLKPHAGIRKNALNDALVSIWISIGWINFAYIDLSIL